MRTHYCLYSAFVIGPDSPRVILPFHDGMHQQLPGTRARRAADAAYTNVPRPGEAGLPGGWTFAPRTARVVCDRDVSQPGLRSFLASATANLRIEGVGDRRRGGGAVSRTTFALDAAGPTRLFPAPPEIAGPESRWWVEVLLPLSPPPVQDAPPVPVGDALAEIARSVRAAALPPRPADLAAAVDEAERWQAEVLPASDRRDREGLEAQCVRFASDWAAKFERALHRIAAGHRAAARETCVWLFLEGEGEVVIV